VLYIFAYFLCYAFGIISPASSVPQTPCFVPHSKFLATPLTGLMHNILITAVYKWRIHKGWRKGATNYSKRIFLHTVHMHSYRN